MPLQGYMNPLKRMCNDNVWKYLVDKYIRDRRLPATVARARERERERERKYIKRGSYYKGDIIGHSIVLNEFNWI